MDNVWKYYGYRTEWKGCELQQKQKYSDQRGQMGGKIELKEWRGLQPEFYRMKTKVLSIVGETRNKGSEKKLYYLN